MKTAAVFILVSCACMMVAVVQLASGAPPDSHAAATQATLDDRLVFPGFRTQGQPDSIVHPETGRELIKLHGDDGTRIEAMVGKAIGVAHGARLPPSVIYFYGNGMCMADSVDELNRLRRLGFNVIVADYEGYGMSGGTPSEGGCYAVADAEYDYLVKRKDVDPGRIIAVGWSLGAAVAIDLANRRPIAGLVTFSAFTSIPDMSRAHLNQSAPAILLASRFDNLSKIRTVKCPILMAHGTQDQLVPPEMLIRLSAAAKSNVTIVHVNGAGHNDIFERGGDSLDHKVKIFVDSLHG
jgi:pimeloyl-ACP methyl ester carboxylesterase